jgi:S-DNA-T family DNA segregation ATPase FtsK/SpoIIIE
MTIRLVHRPTRITEPLIPAAPETIAAPPTTSDGQVGGHALHTLLPVLGALTSVTMIVVLRNNNPLFLVVGAVLLIVALVGGVGLAVTQRGSAARTRRTQRELYLDHLETLRATMRERARDVRERANNLDPEPAALLELIRDPGRLWERRRSNADFLRVRVGSGDLPWFELTVPPEENPVTPYDPIMLAEAEAVARHYSLVLGVPITTGLDGAGQVAVIGDRADVLDVARSMILQLSAFHSPDDLLLAASFAPEVAADWEGFDLLPHAVDPLLFDGPVPARRVAASTEELRQVLGAELADRAQVAAAAKRSIGRTEVAPISRLVVFCDDHGRLASALPVADADLSLADLQITTVHLLSDRLHEPSDVTVRVSVVDGRATVTDRRPVPSRHGPSPDDLPAPPRTALIDRPSPALFQTIARALTPLRLSLSRAEAAESDRGVEITELLGIDDVEQVSPDLWTARSPREFLRVPIGSTTTEPRCCST